MMDLIGIIQKLLKKEINKKMNNVRNAKFYYYELTICHIEKIRKLHGTSF